MPGAVRRVAVLVALVMVLACRPPGRGAAGPEGEAGGWTLLVYVAADDNLERAAILDIQEMAAAASSERVRVIVQIDRAGAERDGHGFVRAPLLNLPDFHTVKRLRVEQASVTELADLGERSTGAVDTLADFVAWGLRTYPAERVALVMWDHGAATAGFGWDWTNDHQGLSIPDLRAAITKGLGAANRKKLDVIGFDACLMATVEVAYELAGLADVLVASEELEPAHGWFYTSIVEALATGPSPAELGKAAVASYQKICAEKKSANGCTLAAFDLDKVGAVVGALDALGVELGAKLASDEGFRTVARARADTEQYGTAPGKRAPFSLVDVGHFAANTSAGAAQALRDAIGAATLASYRGPSMPNGMGMSMAFPYAGATRRPSDGALAFAGRAGWQGFLAAYAAREASDKTAPIVSQPVARVADGGRSYDVSATIAGDDVAKTFGFVGREAPGGGSTLLTAVRVSNGSPSFTWNRTIDTVTDGTATSPLTTFEESRYTDASGRSVSFLVTAGRILPAEGGAAEAFEVVVYLDAPGGDLAQARIRAIYELDEDGASKDVEPSEVEVEPGDRYEPLLYGFDAADNEVWRPSGVSISLADEDRVALAKSPAPAGAYVVGILAVDLAGNDTEKGTDVTIP